MSGDDLTLRAALHAEIDRDEAILVTALCHELRQLADSVWGARHVSLEDLWFRVHDVIAASRAARGKLSSIRVMTRGERVIVYNDSAPLPAALHRFRHRGNYRGAFTSVAEVGNIVRSALGLVCGLPPESRIHVTHALHLRGDLWTYVHEKMVHVFGRPGSAADRLLASERPPIVEAIPRPVERPILSLVVSPRPQDADAPQRLDADAPMSRPSSIALVHAPESEGRR